MILELKIKNYLSFKDEVTFSFEATREKHLEEYQVVEVAKGVRILKLCIVYGANASGKSNLVSAFEFLRKFWLETTENKDEGTKVVPFLLNDITPDEPSEFILTFYIERTKYVYTLKLTQSEVILESLKYYTSSQPTEIFTRQLKDNISEIKFNPAFKISTVAKEEIVVKCLTNMSVFAAYNAVNVHLPELDIVIEWRKKQFLSYVSPAMDINSYTKKIIAKDDTVRDFILKFLHEADYNINNINLQKEKVSMDEETIEMLLRNNNISQKEKERIQKEHTINVTQTIFSHKIINNSGGEAVYELPESLQSKGTLRTMGLAGVINLALIRNAFIVIDEIESSLHPKLVEFVIESFLKQSQNAQMLVTTHYDGLLEEGDLLRNDNIWFTSKKKDGATELYSLSDFKGLSRISSLQKAYKYGKFGAIPNI